MKIAFRISAMGFGGAERVFLSVADGLSKLYRIDIHFVVDAIGKGETEAIAIEKGYKLIGLNSKRTLQTIVPLKDYLEREQPDILISAYPDTNFAALISKKIANTQCKVIVSEHAPLREHWKNVSFIRKILLNIYVRLGYRLANHILAVSKGLNNELITFGLPSKKISFIHNPVRFSTAKEPSHQPLTDSKKVKTIIAVGRISRAKDYLTLLKAFHHIYREVNAKLLIVGGFYEIAEKQRLDHFIQEHQLSDAVTFTGFTENVQSHYESADVFALSSAWEGFGNVLVEAMAFGLPIVSTNCHYGPPEILNEGKFGKLVPVGDWQAMAVALKQTLNQLDQVDSAALKNRALDFSEENIAKQYWQLFQKVLHQ